MKEIRYIVDTTLRDGEQSPGITLRAEDKVKIAKQLDELGVYEIEAGIPASGREEEESILRIVNTCHRAKISVWCRMNQTDIQKAIQCKPDIIHIGVPVSYVQIYNKLKKNKTWLIKTLLSCIDMTAESGIDLTIGFEDASRADMGFLIHLSNILEKTGVQTVRLADTVGIMTPDRTLRMIKDIKEHSGIALEYHAHNDLGMAVANSISAAKAGAQFIDCTLGGIGERSGNCNFYDFLYVSETLFHFGISKEKVKELENKIGDVPLLEGVRPK